MARGELSILSECCNEKSTLPSRRSVLKHGSLGVAGAAGLMATGGALMGKRAHAAELASSSIVGIWQGTVTDTAGLTLPPLRATFLFSADGNNFTASGKRLKLRPAGIQLLEIPFNVTAKRLADPGAA